MSDFGLSERFVADMKGVALQVDAALTIHDLTHIVEPFNIWEAAHTLAGTVAFWPQGTVFIAVVDPGVGTERKSVVARTGTGHFLVTPDNGTLTLVADQLGISGLREIDESVNRRPGSEVAHTFHGRDVYVFTGARLAAGVISFKQVGPKLEQPIVKLRYQKAELSNDVIAGSIVKIEKPFGNIVTNISLELAAKFGFAAEEKMPVHVEIGKASETVLRLEPAYVNSFGHVAEGQPLLYADSNGMLGLAVNSGDFSGKYGVKAGAGWSVKILKK